MCTVTQADSTLNGTMLAFQYPQTLFSTVVLVLSFCIPSLMNPFSACIKQQPIRLSEEDDEEHQDALQHRNCALGWPFATCFKGLRTRGRIRLPDDAAADDILEDYLDPNTTVGIEPLLAQHAIPDNQVEDDDEDDNNKQFMKHDMFDEPHRFLSRNPFATTSSSSGILGSTDFYDEDAQFLSDRRISDVLEQNQEV